jgi:hypothetical protein
MAKFTVRISGNAPVWADVEVEAETAREAYFKVGETDPAETDWQFCEGGNGVDDWTRTGDVYDADGRELMVDYEWVDEDEKAAAEAELLGPRVELELEEEKPMNNGRTERIAELNDLARTAMGVASRVIQTEGVRALDPQDQSKIREKVELFKDFNDGDNPYGERDFGWFRHNGEKIYWKIDYFDRTGRYASPDPADPGQTLRVLTIMLAEEY